jgi:hypothetical protein
MDRLYPEKADEAFVRKPKNSRYRVKRIAFMKDVIVAEGWNGVTNVHSVFEADVNANSSDEAIKMAMLFFPPAYGSTKKWIVQCCRIEGGKKQIEEYAGSSYKAGDIAEID